MSTPSDVAEEVVNFFARYEGASLKLPSGWFGRPFDNFHRLSAAVPVDDRVEITLDDVQVLRLDVASHSSEPHLLTIRIQSGEWQWTSYGGTDRHVEQLQPGSVEFHALPGR